jgi:cytochrome c
VRQRGIASQQRCDRACLRARDESSQDFRTCVQLPRAGEKGLCMKTLAATLLCASMLIASMLARAADFDEDAARHLAKKSGCFKCHAIDKKKDAPPFAETAKKCKPDAEEELYKHLTTNPKVKVDGKEERHKSPKTKDEKEIRNLIHWILSLA